MHSSIRIGLLLVPAALWAQAQERRIEYGFEHRVRNENWNNIFDYNDATDDERGQIRYRTRLWMRAPVNGNISVQAGWVQETNQIFQPRSVTYLDEVVFEAAVIDIKKLFVKGLSLRLGRQNLMKGDNFLFLEGNPYDGSRSIYANTAVLGIERGKSRLELIGISNPRTDRCLPAINSKARPLIEWNETALGAYYTNNRFARTSLESYYFYKREYGDTRLRTNPQFQGDRYVYTAGGRVVQKLTPVASVTAELAGQWGHQRPNLPIRGWGGYAYLKRNFGPKGRHNALFGYWGMSGSDPANPGRIGNFDPLFGRWPKWSEMYIYSQFREVGVGYWTNVGMWQGEVVYVPWKPLSVRGTYYYMQSFHPFAGSSAIYSTGTTRGNHYQARADLVVNKNWRGHVLYERLAPGSFYTGKSPGMFFRLEAIYTLTGSVHY